MTLPSTQTTSTLPTTPSAPVAWAAPEHTHLRPPAAWLLALRQLRRDFRAGELRLLLLAVALAVGALSAVGFFADRLQAGLQRDAGALLGGDAVVASDQPLPPEFAQAFPQDIDLSIEHSLRRGIKGADVVYCLRMQTERQGNFFVPSLLEYSRDFCVSEKLLAELAPKAIVMHPGPINRGCEISSEVADGPRSLVADQVTNGVAARMAVLFSLATRPQENQ